MHLSRFIGLAVAFTIAFLAGCGFNTVVQADENVKGTWAEVESQYQRRADLVPNLVATVRGAAAFEQSTLTADADTDTDTLVSALFEKTV
jgi:LemA protein